MGKLYDQYLVEMDFFYEYQRRNEMIFVKIDEWGKCQICGHNGHIRFGVCGGDCVEVWQSQGKWEWDKDNPNLAKITCNGKVWYYKETRPGKMTKSEGRRL